MEIYNGNFTLTKKNIKEFEKFEVINGDLFVKFRAKYENSKLKQVNGDLTIFNNTWVNFYGLEEIKGNLTTCVGSRFNAPKLFKINKNLFVVPSSKCFLGSLYIVKGKLELEEYSFNDFDAPLLAKLTYQQEIAVNKKYPQAVMINKTIMLNNDNKHKYVDVEIINGNLIIEDDVFFDWSKLKMVVGNVVLSHRKNINFTANNLEKICHALKINGNDIIVTMSKLFDLKIFEIGFNTDNIEIYIPLVKTLDRLYINSKLSDESITFFDSIKHIRYLSVCNKADVYLPIVEIDDIYVNNASLKIPSITIKYDKI